MDQGLGQAGAVVPSVQFAMNLASPNSELGVGAAKWKVLVKLADGTSRNVSFRVHHPGHVESHDAGPQSLQSYERLSDLVALKLAP